MATTPPSPLDLINDDLATPADPANPGKTTDAWDDPNVWQAVAMVPPDTSMSHADHALVPSFSPIALE